MAKSWNLYNKRANTAYVQYRGMYKGYRTGVDESGVRIRQFEKANYHNQRYSGFFYTSIRSTGCKDLIVKLDSMDRELGTSVLEEALHGWGADILECLSIYPFEYDTDNRWIWNAYAQDCWDYDFSITNSGVSCSIFNSQLSKHGFDYVKFINDGRTTKGGKPFRTPAHFIEDTLYWDNDPKTAVRKWLVPVLASTIAKYGL